MLGRHDSVKAFLVIDGRASCRFLIDAPTGAPCTSCLTRIRDKLTDTGMAPDASRAPVRYPFGPEGSVSRFSCVTKGLALAHFTD